MKVMKSSRYFSRKLVIGSFLLYWIWCLGPVVSPVIRLYLSRNIGDKDDTMVVAKSVSNSISSSHAYKMRNIVARVPKTLHRMWKVEDTSTMPRHWRRAFTKCNKIHSNEWKTILWTDEMIRSFIERRFPWFLEKFDSYRYPIQRVDVARYFILYYYGGVYLDLDISCPRALDALLDTMYNMDITAMIPMTNPIGYSNDVMFATRRHPFFHLLTKSLKKNDGWYGSEYLTIMFSTGPMFLSTVYQDMPKLIKGDVGRLHPEIYAPTKGSTYNFFQHLKGQSWHGKDAKLIKYTWNAIHSNERYFFVLFLLGSIALVLSTRRRRRLRRRPPRWT